VFFPSPTTKMIICFHKNKLITGRAVALHCCNDHSKISRKMGISTQCRIATPHNFILKFGTLCLSHTLTHKFWGRSSRRGVLPKHVKYNTVVTFSAVLIFSQSSPQVKQLRWHTAQSLKQNMPQNPSKMGVNRQFQASLVRSYNRNISVTLKPIVHLLRSRGHNGKYAN